MIHILRFSESALDYIKTYGKDNLKLIHNIRKWVRKLVYVRNKLLDSMKDLHLFRNIERSERLLYHFRKEDHAKITEVFTPLLEEGYMDYKTIFKIDTKKERSEYDSEIEISD